MEPGAIFHLQGVGGVGDPLAAHALERGKQIAEQANFTGRDRFTGQHTPLGAIALDGAVLVALEDPADDMRSACAWWVLLPGAKLRTRTPDIAVRVQRSDSHEWDDPSANFGRPPQLIDLVCIHTGQILITIGTATWDQYYPCAAFRHYPLHMQVAIVEGTRRELDGSTAEGQRDASNTRL